MKNRAVRIALFLLVVFAFAGASYEIALLDRRAAASRDAARAFEEKARQAEASVRELRAAQFAYVAAGQGPAFWTGRATALLAAIASQLHELDALGKAVVAAGLDAGAEPTALDDLATVQRIDASVQGYLRSEQPLLASDLIFTDLREADQAMHARIEERRHQVAAAHLAGAEETRKAEIATVAGAAVFATLVLVLLVPSGRDRRSSVSIAPAKAPASPSAPAAPQPAIAPPQVPRKSIDLGQVATLCTEFARLREASQIPPLLERAANLLDASGIIIWLEDATSGELRPALTFGYRPDALARIRTVKRDDDNATARAYRDRALGVVSENPLGNGAIAAPLLGADGCVGVMAAEIRRGGEAHAEVQAAAAIVAAQLAALVAPAPAADGPSG